MRIRSARIYDTYDAYPPVRPRESGEPGATHSSASKSGPPRPRGRTERGALSDIRFGTFVKFAFVCAAVGAWSSIVVSSAQAQGTPQGTWTMKAPLPARLNEVA